jgi:RNA polymerase sigma-70 factor (ECF subfamily)
VALLAPLHDRARATARRLSACDAEGDDLFHDAVVRACDRLDDLRDPAAFRGWFFAILFTMHRRRARRAFWRKLLPFDFAEGDGPSAPDAPADVVHQRSERFRRALATLPAAAREAVVAVDVEGFTLAELAAVTGEPIGTVKARLSRARVRLRAFYEAELGRS